MLIVESYVPSEQILIRQQLIAYEKSENRTMIQRWVKISNIRYTCLIVVRGDVAPHHEPKNCPKWLLDLWIDREKMWFEIEISFTEILELFNLGMDVMLSRNAEMGSINISLNELGWRFHQR